ncbi:MAG TPA: formylmethanofuran--tetrahydromethanopterin N-formyltransferase, partial [Caulifigura sp.]|nr:formylmethanofuran--tetrahydromethanopterin N-formyltransferase [Caulifigura sp.]
MSGEFVIDRRFGFRDGIMGGNLWFMGVTQQAALEAAEKARDAALTVPDVITPFPGGIASSGSKAGSKYSFLFASTNHPFCPTLREKMGADSQVPAGVVAIQEIIINGRDLETVKESTMRAIEAAKDVPGVVKISAGNYGGRLGKNFIYLRPQP